MSNSDTVVQQAPGVPTYTTTQIKPPHLVTALDITTKVPTRIYYLSLDKGDRHPYGVDFKGVPVTWSEVCTLKHDPVAWVSSLMTNRKKDIKELCVPWERVELIESLIYKSK
jgi:hypothetical protein